MTPRLPDPASALAAHLTQPSRDSARTQRRDTDHGPVELVLIDLDGTLSDSATSILSAVRHAYRALSVPVPGETDLRSFVGPPMQTSLLAHGVPADRLDDAMAAYREHYEHSMLEATAYPGVIDALVTLRSRLSPEGSERPETGRSARTAASLVLATSKPEVFAGRITAHLGLDAHLDAVYGASLDESRLSKAAVIAHALASERDRTGRAVDAARVVMVGDRHHDVEGAREHGIDCIGVLWGYGSREELLGAGAVTVVEDPQELVEAIVPDRRS